MASEMRELEGMASEMRELEGMASETERHWHGIELDNLNLHGTNHLLTDIGRKLPISGSDGVTSYSSLRDPEGL